jgi:hypothetical protein
MADGSLMADAQADTLRCVGDFAYFARRCLKIRSKDGELLPFILNRSQRYLHESIEDQMRRTGRVRKLIVKGRQIGSSTYIEGRLYWRNWKAKQGTSLKAYILTHNQDATDNLFGMAQRFHDNMPEPLQPATKAANAKQLIFADTECGYTVATAGTKEVGRSDTIQLFHGSEVPSWPNAKEHFTSLVTTALAKGPGTEGYLEATAKGVGDVFHLTAQAAIRGESDYEAVFIPWFWGDDYRMDCPEKWAQAVPPKWHEYAVLHKLDWEQLYWAFVTNRELAKAHSLPDDEPCWVFRQEYPATFEEAFQSSGNSFIPGLSVLKARQKRTGSEKIIGRGPIILGIDPAAQRDKVGIVDRCGRVLGERICERWAPNPDVEYVGARVAAIIDRIKPDAVNIDTSEGFGAALYAWLTNHGFALICNAVSFGSGPIGCGPTGDELYANRRAEMWDVMRFWFETPGGVQIPDDDGLHADITAPQWGSGQTRNSPTTNELIIEPKDKIKERLGASPDLGDAAALTFAVPFAEGMQAQNQPRAQRRGNSMTGY